MRTKKMLQIMWGIAEPFQILNDYLQEACA